MIYWTNKLSQLGTCHSSEPGAAIMRRFFQLLAVAALIAGCATETIYMKNRTTGEIAKCGGHSLAFPIYATVASTHYEDCVNDYKEQGYFRVPGQK